MKAVVNDRYGWPDVLEIREIRKPEPQANEILVQVHATTVSRTDCGMLRGRPALFVRPIMGLFRPKRNVLGIDFAGTVVAAGAGATSFRSGERVFGMSPDDFGAHAEYLCMPENGAIASVPSGFDFDEAVICEGAWYADSYLKRFGITKGQKILVYGASGAIGTAAVQLAKFYGAEVTAVVATRHLDLVKSLGADWVIDYTNEDFTSIDETFDYVFDAVGKTTYFRCRKLLKPRGVFSATDLGPWSQNLALSAWSSIIRSNRVVFPMPVSSRAVVDFLKARMEAGELHGIIDRRYPLQSIVDAYRYVETAQKTGIVVIRVSPEENWHSSKTGLESSRRVSSLP
jgi:NADPH:quinone reductase-like Zn-dependent oxidoreductase